MTDQARQDWRNGVNRDLGELVATVNLLRTEFSEFRSAVERRFDRLEGKVEANTSFVSLSKGKAVAWTTILATVGGVAGAIVGMLLR